MKPTDAKLVADYLLQDFERFSDYLSNEHAIDSTEATQIVEAIAGETGGAIPTCTEQFSGFVGE
jgi:hypothetical protein